MVESGHLYQGAHFFARRSRKGCGLAALHVHLVAVEDDLRDKQ